MNVLANLGDLASLDVARARSVLASVEPALADPDLELRELNDLRAQLHALAPLLRRVGPSTVLHDASIAYRIKAESLIGQRLAALPDRSGGSTDEPTELQRATRDLGIDDRTARRWRAIGRARPERVDAYIAPALDALERSVAGEGSPDEPGVRLSTRQLEQISGSDSAGADDAAARADRDDDDDGIPALHLPDGLVEVSLRVLGGVDRHVGAQGMRDRHWQGRVLVTPPPTSAAPYADHLRRLYELGAVSDAILIVRSSQHSWWHPFAWRPHCLLASAAPGGRPAAPLTVFLLARSVGVHERFISEFRRLGHVYPRGAVVEIGPMDGGAGPATPRAAA